MTTNNRHEHEHEHEQAMLRIIIGGLALLHFSLAPQTELSPLLQPQLISGLFLLYALLNRLSLQLQPAPSILRRNLNMAMDLGATSLVIGMAGEAGSPLIAIYLWVIMGNGFRYGVTELRRAAAIGLAGFSLVILFSTFWSNHLFFSSGFLIVLFAIPCLLELIEQLLTQAQLESNHPQIDNQPFSLDLLLAETSALFKKRIEDKELHYHHHIDSKIPKQLNGDPQKLKQILNNLLGNALKFTEQGQIEVLITLCKQHDKHAQLRFEVNDSGIGISQNEQARIFERFQQANNSISSRYGGSGLGTAIVKENVTLMGGKIGLNSELNVGSCFWFELTFEIAAEALKKPLAVNNKTTSFSIEAYQRSKNPNLTLNILAADDNAVNRLVIKKILTRAGHSITLVNDGNDALSALEEQNFDLAILDMNMQNMGGLEVLKNHRFKYPNDQIPILMLSADATELTINCCLTAGAAYYLTKPLDSKRLLDAINSAAVKNQNNSTPRLIAQTEQPSSHQNLINEQTLHELSSIDPHENFVAELIKGFQRDGDKLLKKAEQALQTPIDFLNFKNSVHALKGNAAELGADKLFQFCQRAEKISLRELHQQQHQPLYNELEQLYRETLAAFQEHITISF